MDWQQLKEYLNQSYDFFDRIAVGEAFEPAECGNSSSFETEYQSGTESAIER